VSVDEVALWNSVRREHWDVCVSTINNMCDTQYYFLAAFGVPR